MWAKRDEHRFLTSEGFYNIVMESYAQRSPRIIVHYHSSRYELEHPWGNPTRAMGMRPSVDDNSDASVSDVNGILDT